MCPSLRGIRFRPDGQIRFTAGMDVPAGHSRSLLAIAAGEWNHAVRVLAEMRNAGFPRVCGAV